MVVSDRRGHEYDMPGVPSGDVVESHSGHLSRCVHELWDGDVVVYCWRCQCDTLLSELRPWFWDQPNWRYIANVLL